MEFLLVTAISGILILGLAAVIEVPRRVAEEEMGPETPLSSLDRTLDILDDDVRFAADVNVPNLARLEVTRGDGQAVVYTWGGGGGPLVRAAPEGTANVVDSALRVRFYELTQEVPAASAVDGSLLETAVETAKFDTFQLKPGYTLVGSGNLELAAVPVTVQNKTMNVEAASWPGVVFTASGLSGDEGFPSAVTLRMRRLGPDDLMVSVYQAFPKKGHYEIDRAAPVARGKLANGRIPTSFQDVTVPLVPTGTVQDGALFLVEAAPAGGDKAVELQYQKLSDEAAAASMPTLLTETGDGVRFYALGSQNPDAVQTPFALVANAATAVAPSAVEGTDTVVVGIRAEIVVTTPSGKETVKVSVPMVNRLALVQK